MTTKVSSCRSCKGRIIWCETYTGKRIPVDRDPVDGGNILIREPSVGSDIPFASINSQPVAGGHMAHFATCPNADAHRR